MASAASTDVEASAVAGPPVNNGAPTFQDAISRLQTYWANQGCAVYLPHNTEVGAGTMNPATFLRALGPEPWNVCYPEPSIRPDDSRYGDNPNRVQRHTQFQVILKPDPGNAQELYLGSLEALGIDTRAHDVRFVEDNWESPVLGAWGLGWEVWLDGMEVTQFTYFQQAGSQTLPKVAVEITYGLERIIMNLQNVKHFKDIRYTDALTYGELFMQNEYEMSCFNMDEADVEEHKTRFDLFDKEAKRMLAKRLPVPAYDQLLKSSHAFNVLDARGAVGVTERAALFARMRQLARSCAGLWLDRREELGYPLGVVPDYQVPQPLSGGSPPEGPATFVFEIGTEELPAADVSSAQEQVATAVPLLLAAARLDHGDIHVGATARRVSVVVQQLAPRQHAREDKIRGPPATVAFDADGEPTKAALGFCKKNGIDMANVTREADKKGTEYLYAVVREEGKCAAEVLAAELPALVAKLSFPRSMRWQTEAAFSRPVRWLLAVHGEQLVPVVALGVASSNVTRLLRNALTTEAKIEHADDYAGVLEGATIVTDMQARRAMVLQQAKEAAAAVDGCIPESSQGELLDEITNLVEAPSPVLGTFQPSFLSLPREVLVMVMRKHQRYFPVESASGELMPYFVTVANGAIHPPTVKEGNEAVLQARYEDAKFFYNLDLQKPLADLRPALAGITFETKLGNMLDKSDRTEKLVAPLGALIGCSEDDTAIAKEAAHVARADLASSLVMEFTSLAGVMGKHYAQKEGRSEEVAEAIWEAVLPRSAEDSVPQSPAGQLISMADRLDSLVGLFAVGCAPSAGADPYGLRRVTYGFLQTAVQNNIRMDLPLALKAAAEVQPVEVTEAVLAEAEAFVLRRLEQLLVDAGNSVEAVRAVVSERGSDPALVASTVVALNAELGGARLAKVMTALARPTRLMRGKEGAGAFAELNLDIMLKEEKALYEAYKVGLCLSNLGNVFLCYRCVTRWLDLTATVCASGHQESFHCFNGVDVQCNNMLLQ